jgi:hypothetical protein
MSLSPGELNDLLKYEPPATETPAPVDPELQSLLDYEPSAPAKKPVPAASPEVQKLLNYEPNSAEPLDTTKLSDKAINEKHAGDLQKDVLAADAKRKELLNRITTNERIAAAVKEMESRGAGSGEIEAFKQKEGWTEPSFLGAVGKTFARLGKTESSFPLDVNVAMEGRSEAFSPLTFLGSIIQNVTQFAEGKKQSGISGTDKDVTENVKRILSKPIIDKYGLIDPEAVAVSDLPRYQQNELMLNYAEQRTHVSKEVWRNILGARGGVMADDTDAGAMAKRVARVVDEAAFNLPSWKLTKMTTDEKLDLLKNTQNIPIPIDIVWDGDTAYANGVEVKDAHRGDSAQELEREGWRAILDSQKGQVESQAMENWQSIASMFVPAGGSLKMLGKGLSAGAKATSLASKTGKVLEALGKPGQVIEGAVQGVTRVSPKLTLKLAELEKTSPALAKGLAISGKAATKVLTPAVLGAVGAPEGTEREAFVGGVALGGTFALVEPAMAAIYRARDPMKAILRTPEYDKLPSFVKKYVDTHLPEGVPYEEFRQNTINGLELRKMVSETQTKIKAGQLPPEAMEMLLEEGSKSPKLRGYLDMLSTGGDPDGITPVGRTNKQMMQKLLDDQVSRSSADQKKLKNQGDSSQYTMLKNKIEASSNLSQQLPQIPNHVLNDTESLIRVLRGEEVKGFKLAGGEFLADTMEGLFTSGSDNLPYRVFMQDYLKVAAAAADASNPRILAELMDLVGNKPEFAKHFQAVEKLGRTNVTSVFDTELAGISPTKSAEKLLKVGGPQEIKNIVNLAMEDIGLYTSMQGKRKVIGMNSAELRMTKMLQEEKLRQYRFKTSLDAEFIDRQLKSMAGASNDLDQSLKLTSPTPEGAARPRPSKLDKLSMYLQDPSFPENRKQQLQDIIDRVNKGGTIAKSEMLLFPAKIQKQLEDVGYTARKGQEIKASMQEALIQRGAIDERIVKSRSINLQKEALYDKPSKAASVALGDLNAELVGKHQVPGLTDSKYYQNVVGMIAEEIGDSLERTGSVSISPESIGYLRLLQNRKFVKEVIGFNGFNNADYKRFVTRVGNAADTLYGLSAEGAMWKKSIALLDSQIKSDKASVPGIARNLKMMRQAFKVSRMQRELDKRAYALYDLAERYADTGVISKKDTKNLVEFMTGSMVQRYRLAKDPTWIVTRAEEAENVFGLIKNTTPLVMDELKNVFSDVLGKDKNDLNVSVVASWFLTPSNDFDKSGYLGAAMQLAKYYRKGSASPRYLEFFSNIANQEVMATVISKETGYAVAADVSRMAQGKMIGKARADKLVMGFFDERDALKVGSKSYIDFQGHKPFIEMAQKSIIGLRGIKGRLVQKGVETELGMVFRKWVAQGQTDESLTRIMEEWKGGVKSREIDNQAIDMADSLKRYWRVQGLDSESHEMGIKYIQLWQKHDELKVNEWNLDNSRLNARDGTRVAVLEYQPARLETNASITSRVTYDTSNMESLSSMDTMFGRQVRTNETGQNMKAQVNDSLADLMHPDDLFHSATHKLFQDLHSREPRRRLWEKGLLMENAGCGAFATVLTRSFLGGLSTSGPDTRRALEYVFNKLPGFKHAKVLSPLIQANYLLVSLGQAAQNFGQNAQMQALNPFQATNAFKTLVRSVPGFMKGMVARALNNEDMVEAAAVAGNVPSPKYAEINAQLIAGLNPTLSAKMQSKLGRINWDVSPLWKKTHAGFAGLADPIFEHIQGSIKENADSTTYRIVLGQAANIWETAGAAARSVSDQGEGAMFRAAAAALEKPLAGVTGSRVDTAQIAMSLVKELGTEGTAAYERFATAFCHQSLTRYDPGNVPAMVRIIDRMLPSTAQFFNPLTGGLYRLLAAGHTLVTERGRDAGHVGVAVATIAGLYGLSSFWLAASKTTGMTSLTKMIPLAGFQSIVGQDPKQEAKNQMEPSLKVGSMQNAILLDLFWRTASLVKSLATATGDGTADTAALNAKLHDDWMRIIDLAVQTTPNILGPLLRDFVYSPGKLGYAYLDGGNPHILQELQGMAEKDQLNLKTAPEGMPLAGEENSFMASMFKLLTVLTPRKELHETLYDFTPDNMLEYLAKEKAIPLSFLYQMREARRKEAQHKQDLETTIMGGEGVGQYKPDPAYTPDSSEEETPEEPTPE